MKTLPPLQGQTTVPGDKSIGHRAILFGSIANGPVRITGLSDGEDIQRTRAIMEELGVSFTFPTSADPGLTVHGRGLDGLQAPNEPLDCGNSGTTMRLLLGLLAGQPFKATLVGDASLSTRPMARVLDPLREMGLEVLRTGPRDVAPLTVRGQRPLRSIHYESPIASAQVKSAILLAGLYADGPTTVNEPALSRDHTERLIEALWDGQEIRAEPLFIPGDLSSAAFILGAALLVPRSEITIKDVGVNPTRTGFLDVLTAMGASFELGPLTTLHGEPRADITIRHTHLRPTAISGTLSVRSLDELPLIATLASQATGRTTIRDARELRVKESDRIAKTAELLKSFGVPCEEQYDGLIIDGDPNRHLKPGKIDASGDHRIAMCAHLLSLRAPGPSHIAGASSIASSFPSFISTLEALGVPPGLLQTNHL